MNVLVQGQEFGWVKKLQQICQDNGIMMTEEYETEEKYALLICEHIPSMGGCFAETPFLIVSKDGEEEKILKAFENGAEDYIVLPVNPRIVVVRIKRILERYGYAFGAEYTPNEKRLLSYMQKYPYRAFSREELLEGAFDTDYEGIDRNVDNYIKEIRKKWKNVQSENKIQTVYGVGYRYVP